MGRDTGQALRSWGGGQRSFALQGISAFELQEALGCNWKPWAQVAAAASSLAPSR
jgi:hypothetical protein